MHLRLIWPKMNRPYALFDGIILGRELYVYSILLYFIEWESLFCVTQGMVEITERREK